MKVEYRRDIQNSYLVLIAENQDADKSYDLRMITENQIESLLSCERKLLNNDILYYYNVTSLISLEDRCKADKIQGQEILLILNKLLGTLDKLEEYLLSEKSLCLLPQYIYINDNVEQINFCYVPGEKWDIQVQLRELMEYLLPYLEHSTQESMMIGYGLYHYILRERFTVEGLHAQLNLYRGIDKNRAPVVEMKEKEIVETNLISQKDEEVWQDIWDEGTEIEKENGTRKEYFFYVFCTLAGLLWVLSGWFLWRNFSAFLWIWAMIGGLSVFVFTLISLIWVKKKPEKRRFLKEHKEEHKIDQNEVCTQVLNVEPNRKAYVLKNENHTISLKNKDIYIIGRDENAADVVMQSAVISRKHAQIRFENNKCFLKDLYSKNGIRVNGVEIVNGGEIELFGGELIQFADISCYFQQEN